MPYASIQSPLGTLSITSNGSAITAIRFKVQESEDAPDDLTNACADELKQYFRGTLSAFTVPIESKGTSLQQRVWQSLLRIPYGETRTYGELAHACDMPRSARAIGTTCGKNPILIIIPCHRVVAAHALGGYNAGQERKHWLLKHEMRCATRSS